MHCVQAAQGRFHAGRAVVENGTHVRPDRIGAGLWRLDTVQAGDRHGLAPEGDVGMPPRCARPPVAGLVQHQFDPGVAGQRQRCARRQFLRMHIQFAEPFHEGGMLVRRQRLVRKDEDMTLVKRFQDAVPSRIIHIAAIDTVDACAQRLGQRL
jgi:hypothetical protein